GSKWKTIPELMLTYRAGAWWTRIFCPELALGLHTTDEIEDMGPIPQPSRQHISVVTRALHAADDEPETVEATEVSAGDDEGREPADARLAELHRKYFAALREQGIDDRQTFQADLHARALVSSPSCREWRAGDYRSAIAAIAELAGAEI